MFTKRNVLRMGMLFVLLLSAACGAAAPAATQAPAGTEQLEEYYSAATQAPAATESPSSGDMPEAPQSNLNSAQSNSYIPPANIQPTDMFFQNYGVNPSIETMEDHLSTFALDVDTGSYTMMRNYLKDGNLPPPESVRVEEYVNYFDQGYGNPPAHQAFGIYIDGASSPFTQTERYQMLRVGIQGYQVSKQERKDAALTFVIDVSGSMAMDNRLELVKHSLELLVEQLHSADTVSIVVYGTDARVILDPTPVLIKEQSSKRFIACSLKASRMPKPESV